MKRIFSLSIALLSPLAILAAPLHNVREFQMKSGLSSNTVNILYQDSRGFIWAGTKEGLDRFNTDGIVRIMKEKTNISAVCEVNGTLFAGTRDGLVYYDAGSGTTKAFTGKTQYGVPIIHSVTCLEKADDNSLLVGTWGQGVFLLDTRDGSLTQYSIEIPFIRCAAVSDDNHLYVGTGEKGIYRITPPWSENSISLIIPRTGINDLYVSGHQLWYAAGTVVGCADLAMGGRIREKDCGAAVSSIAAWPERQLILGSSDGLLILRPDDWSLRRPELSYDGTPLGKLSVTHTFLDREGTLWAASRDAGVIALTEKDRLTDMIPLPFSCKKMKLQEMNDGSLLVGTDQGTVRLTFRDRQVTMQRTEGRASALSGEAAEGGRPEEDVVSARCQDSRGYCYEAVKNCIYKSDMRGTRKEYYTFYGTIHFLHCDRQDQIWIGTDGKGLWVLADGEFRPFFIERADRESRTSCSILEDNEGYLWIAGDIGIAKIDPRNRQPVCLFSSEAQNDADRFIPGAALKSPVHGLCFGKKNGLICIHPSDLTVNRIRPKVSINSISFRGGSAPMSGFTSGQTVRIPWTDNSFTIHFSVQSYQEPALNRTAWQMGDAVDREIWSRDNQASFNRLRPGKYTFSVRGRNNDGIESRQSATLHIIVIPPWWGSRWAIAGYILVACCALVFLYRWQRWQLKKKYQHSLQKSQENFFIGMVHEIRTPITIIRLALDSIVRDGPAKENIKAIRDNLDYMQETVNGILTYNRNNTSGIRYTKKRTDLNALCAVAADSFQESARLRQFRLNFAASPEPILVMADEIFLRKVLNNLLGNAFKYARGLIRISTALENGNALIRIEDDGPGVKDSEKEKIFELFYKASGDKVAEASGIGVGLPYSAQIVSGHGGSIRVEDRQEGGAIFTVCLPALAAEEPLPAGFAGDDADASENGREMPRIIVADDNLSLLTMLERELSHWYQVRMAKDGTEVLRLIEEEGTDVIVSDVMMPVMDGIELCRIIKGQMDYSHIPFILLTAKTSVDAKTEGMESGADAYVEKPFSVSQLHHQIDNLLKLRKSLWKKLKGPDDAETALQGDFLNKYDRQFLDTVNATIEQQLQEDNISIDALAGTLCMSKTNFYRKFHAITGDSPNEYIKNYRLRRAAALIREGARINEAAYAVGFYSSSYFAKCFKARYGVLPKDYGKK